MNYLDILIIIPLIIGGWRGYKKGLIIEVFTLMALLIGIYAGIHFSDAISDWLNQLFNMDSEYLPIIAFMVTFIGVGAGVYFSGVMLEKVVNMVAMKLLNKLLGLFFGFLKFLFFTSVALVIVEAFDEKSTLLQKESKEKSLLYHPVKETSLTTIPALRYSNIFVSAWKKSKELEEEVDATH